MADNTVYDSAFKTMVHKAPKLMIPLVNEVFGRNYPADAEVTQFSNEHEGPSGSRITDSVFQIGRKIYHVECQSTADSNMVVRMMEYDFAIALEGALKSGKPYVMDFPASCVLFLRHSTDTPNELEMQVNLPDGDSFLYRVKVMKAQSVSGDEMFEKHLLLLLPYYLMRYEDQLSEIEGNTIRTNALIAECARLRTKLEAATIAVGDNILYEQLIELIIRVNDYLLAAHDTLRQEVKGTMGGEVWELMGERAERLEREAREEGREEAMNAIIRNLREQGVDESIINAAVAAATLDTPSSSTN